MFGVKDTLTCLDMGAVETLIVWENLDMQRYVFTNTTSGGCGRLPACLSCLPAKLALACLPACQPASCHTTSQHSYPSLLRCLLNSWHCCPPPGASPAACLLHLQAFRRSSS